MYRKDAAAVERLLGIGEAAVDAKADRVELAAMTDVCLAIFNLSETVTRK